MPYFSHRGLEFHYIDQAGGVPFVFLHGLGGSTGQTAGLFPALPLTRLISLDCRNHGLTEPAVTGAHLGFPVFARDVCALLAHLGIRKAHFGGISMGAGVCLRIALDSPDLVQSLTLVRPAWLDGPMPAHFWFATVARLLKEHGPRQGRELCAHTPSFAELRAASPDAADSVLRQFDAPQALERVARLEVMPRDSPVPARASLRSVPAPTLVIATDRDPVHPLDLAETLTRELPSAALLTITAKSTSLALHNQELRSALAAWVPSQRAG